MSNHVYVNKREISCKAANGKTICAFPDVCLSPPSPPAGPVPIPYPNTGFASDTTSGTKMVSISGKEVMMKNQSFFAKSTGDEAATKALGMGVLSHNIQGKVYFSSWSMDVKVEGANTVRHLDLTTHNHMSMPGNTPPFPYFDRMAMADSLAKCDAENDAMNQCQRDQKGNVACPPGEREISAARARRDRLPANSARRDAANQRLKAMHESHARAVQSDACQRAARCMLTKYRPNACCSPQTPHHLVLGASFTRANGSVVPGYEYNAAPCICVEGPDDRTATHGLLHAIQSRSAHRYMRENPTKSTWTLSEAADRGARAVNRIAPNCSISCIKAQIMKSHQDMGISPNTNLRLAPTAGTGGDASVFQNAWDSVLSRIQSR